MKLLKTFHIVVLSLMLFSCATVQEQAREEKNEFRIADTNVRLGLGYLKQGRDDAALEKFKKALEHAPDYAEAHSSIALAYTRMDDFEKAEEHYRRAIELKPEDGSIRNNYAVFLCESGKPAKAEPEFLQAIQSRKYRTPAQALENLGVCMMQIPDIEKAETYLRKALQIDPRLPGALLQMAKISFDKKRFMSGRAYLQRYQEVAPWTSEGLWLGILVERQLGDKKAARAYENKLRQNFSDSNEMRLLLEAEAKERAEAAKK